MPAHLAQGASNAGLRARSGARFPSPRQPALPFHCGAKRFHGCSRSETAALAGPFCLRTFPKHLSKFEGGGKTTRCSPARETRRGLDSRSECIQPGKYCTHVSKYGSRGTLRLRCSWPVHPVKLPLIVTFLFDALQHPLWITRSRSYPELCPFCLLLPVSDHFALAPALKRQQSLTHLHVCFSSQVWP